MGQGVGQRTGVATIDCRLVSCRPAGGMGSVILMLSSVYDGTLSCLVRIPCFKSPLTCLALLPYQACGADSAANWSIYPLPPLA